MQRPARRHYPTVRSLESKYAFTLTIKCNFIPPRSGRRDDAAVQTNAVDEPTRQRADARIRLVNNIRTFPSRLAGVRRQRLNLWDISIVKQVPPGGRVRAQFNIGFLNAFNHTGTDPATADFGKMTSQN